jgi:hypothetical protein
VESRDDYTPDRGLCLHKVGMKLWLQLNEVTNRKNNDTELGKWKIHSGNLGISNHHYFLEEFKREFKQN